MASQLFAFSPIIAPTHTARFTSLQHRAHLSVIDTRMLKSKLLPLILSRRGYALHLCKGSVF